MWEKTKKDLRETALQISRWEKKEAKQVCSRHQSRGSPPSLGEDHDEALSPSVAHGQPWWSRYPPYNPCWSRWVCPEGNCSPQTDHTDECSQQDKKEKKLLNFVLCHNHYWMMRRGWFSLGLVKFEYVCILISYWKNKNSVLLCGMFEVLALSYKFWLMWALATWEYLTFNSCSNRGCVTARSSSEFKYSGVS